MKLYSNPILEKALSASWLRNEVISDNVSNVNTPGYKRKDVNFEDYIKAALDKTSIVGNTVNDKHIKIGSDSVDGIDLKVTRDFSSTSMRMDGNNVDIDKEMSELAKNQILYSAYTTLINKDMGMIKSAIKEGR